MLNKPLNFKLSSMHVLFSREVFKVLIISNNFFFTSYNTSTYQYSICKC